MGRHLTRYNSLRGTFWAASASPSLCSRFELRYIRDMSLTVLIVEDNSAMGEMIRDALAARGFNAVHHETLQQARLQLPYCDVALVDVNLPDGNGLQLCMEAVRAGLSTKVIILSGESGLASTALRAGAHKFLLKPVRMRTVVELLKDIQQELVGSRST